MVTVVSLGFLTFLFSFGSGAWPKIGNKELHHHMTKRELHTYFGVSSHSEVPEYDVASPFQSNEHGLFVSYDLKAKRRRRSLDDDEPSHYHVSAFGRKIHMTVRPNRNLMARGLAVEKWHDDGSVTSEPVPNTDRHYLGRTNDDPNSLVAVSNYDGLHGMIHTKDDTLFVQPLPNHLAKHFAEKKGEIPHIFSKSSLKRGMKFEDSPLEKAKDLFPHSRYQETQRSLDSHQIAHKYLEAAIMVDDVVQAHYGKKTKTFVLMVGNIVSGIFHHSSIGRYKINYVVSRIVLITNAQLGVFANATNGQKLGAVGKWASNNNPASDDNPLHFEAISLIQRGGQGGGLALYGGICSTHSPSVNNDQGLQTSLIVAHETGHNIGIDHDNSASCPGGVNIMSPGIPGGTGAILWSNCSKLAFESILQAQAPTSCLNDNPALIRPQLPADYLDKLPGVIWNGDRQCAYQLSSSFFQCPNKKGDCGSLYCSRNGLSCVSHIAPPVDGTRCGNRHWCIKGKCVDDGSPYINGGWSAWSGFGDCTQSCDGGVRWRSRKCTNPPPQNGGDDCAGSSRGHFEICNSTPCPASKFSYRDQQCKSKNSEFLAYYHNDKCALVCAKSGYIYFFGKVKDGTRCYADKYRTDVCIEGECKSVGCDNVLESGKVTDRCGVCAGNGNTCKRLTGNYTKNWRQWGIDKADTILTLPVNTTVAEFKKLAATYNLIGIKDNSSDTYLIELPTWSKSITAAGTKITLIHADNQYKDRLYVLGPTTEPVKVVFVWLYEINQGVTYHYHVPLKSGETAEITTYVWKTSSWQPCSALCAGGVQERMVTCHRVDDSTAAGVQYCNAATKPKQSISCNTQPCEAKWFVTNWQSCSKTCGNGTHSRLIQCRRQISESSHEVLPESKCSSLAKPNVITFQSCNEFRCPPEWKATSWSQCSTTCGPGNTTRNLICKMGDEHGTENVVAPQRCAHKTKPPVIESCNTDKPCSPPPELRIACFKDVSNHSGFPETLADYTSTVDFDDTKPTVLACAQEAHNRGYKYFALGQGGKCYSGPKLKNTYYKDKPTKNAAGCNNGIGLRGYQYVYTLDPLPNMNPLGCYKDRYGAARALPTLIGNFRPQIVWQNLTLTVHQCAHLARDKGYQIFGIQFFGECWAGGKTFDRYGSSTNCFTYLNSMYVGGGWTNYVYTFNETSVSSRRK